MGVFKDGFNAIKGAKELGDYHGGTPSMKGSFKDIIALSDDKGQGEILKHGTPTKARVLGFPVQVDKFSMGVELDVFPPAGGDPYKVQYVFATARMKTMLSVGMEVPVKVMDDDPNAVAVQWDALKGSIAASGGDMAVAMQGIQNTYAGTADAAGRAYLAEQEEAKATAAQEAAANDPAERLKKLGQLKDAGLVTDEEFEAKKAEILADL
ncbi:MAG TPA: SHOCT domain-containing protein [Acidimicrobiia bacterium]|nr:SHOCT domain-containing protein [Acidimicrobiia bacterium]